MARRALCRIQVLCLVLVLGWFVSLSAGERYAFLVGVRSYDKTQLNDLQFSENDVTRLHTVLEQAGYARRNMVLLTQKLGATAPRFSPFARNIHKELDQLLQEVKLGDSVLVAFSGHGVQFPGEPTPYFCPADADLRDRESLISLGTVFDTLQASRAANRLLLVDACRSDPLSNLGKSRRIVELESLTKQTSPEPPGGITAFFSCSRGEQSFEHPELKHGIFFNFVIQGLAGKADLDKDDEISLAELEQFTVKEVQSFSRIELGTLQTPERKGETRGLPTIASVAPSRQPGLPAPPTVAPSENPMAKDGRLTAPFDAEEARHAQAAWAAQLDKPGYEMTNSLGMRLTLLPPGEFLMGSEEDSISVLKRFSYVTPDDIGGQWPQHPVRISQPFYLGTCEVTLGQFLKFYHEAKYKTEAERDGKGGGGWGATGPTRARSFVPWSWGFPEQTFDHPVVNVSWNDAVAFCNWLSQKEGVTYRLPTEAEWEYACKAGSSTRFCFGSDPEDLVRYANVAEQSSRRRWPKQTPAAVIAHYSTGAVTATTHPFPYLQGNDGYSFTAPVGRFRANAFGLHDLHGNVWEWCFDWYDADYYSASPEVDPRGVSSGSHRVMRGGSYSSTPHGCRSASRYWSTPNFRAESIGFRVVAELPSTRLTGASISKSD